MSFSRDKRQPEATLSDHLPSSWPFALDETEPFAPTTPSMSPIDKPSRMLSMFLGLGLTLALLVTAGATSAIASDPRESPTRDPIDRPSPVQSGTLDHVRPSMHPTGQDTYRLVAGRKGKNLRGKVYGAGIAIDAKANLIIDGRKLSHRFRASTTSKLRSITWQRRTGSGYSAGDGGILRISVQSDDGNGRPSGQVLASLRYDVPNRRAASVLVKNTFRSPARLKAGRRYHIVFENVHAAPKQNYVSVNNVFTWNPGGQPSLSWHYAVLHNRNGWSTLGRYTANMDLIYADGTHDGVAYIGILGSHLALIGGQRQARERFTVSGGDRTVREAYVRVGKQSGGGDLVIRLMNASGKVLERGTVPASQVPSWTVGHFRSANGGWVGFKFERARTLRNGQTYQLVLSSPAGSQYSVVPIQHTQDNTSDASGDPLRTRMQSWAFRDGVAQKSTNGGQSWSRLYQYSPNDLQFYLR